MNGIVIPKLANSKSPQNASSDSLVFLDENYQSPVQDSQNKIDVNCLFPPDEPPFVPATNVQDEIFELEVNHQGQLAREDEDFYRGRDVTKQLLNAISEEKTLCISKELDNEFHQESFCRPSEQATAQLCDEESSHQRLKDDDDIKIKTELNVNDSGEKATLIVFDQVFYKHQTAKGCQECPERVESLMGQKGVLRTGSEDADEIHFEEHVQEASISDILRVHEWEYICQLRKLCALKGEANAHKDRDLLSRTLEPPGHPSDTSFSQQSYQVAAMAGVYDSRVVVYILCDAMFSRGCLQGHRQGDAGTLQECIRCR